MCWKYSFYILPVGQWLQSYVKFWWNIIFTVFTKWQHCCLYRSLLPSGSLYSFLRPLRGLTMSRTWQGSASSSTGGGDRDNGVETMITDGAAGPPIWTLESVVNMSWWKKRSDEMQTLHAGCSKAEPKNFTPPQILFPGAREGQNLVRWRWSLPFLETQFGEDRCTEFRVIMATDPPAHPHTNRQDRLQYTALQLAHSVNMNIGSDGFGPVVPIILTNLLVLLQMAWACICTGIPWEWKQMSWDSHEVKDVKEMRK